ncbi:MAG: hypothetical protein AABX11_07095 [Nanoarchaeota archaeon]
MVGERNGIVFGAISVLVVILVLSFSGILKPVYFGVSASGSGRCTAEGCSFCPLTDTPNGNSCCLKGETCFTEMGIDVEEYMKTEKKVAKLLRVCCPTGSTKYSWYISFLGSTVGLSCNSNCAKGFESCIQTCCNKTTSTCNEIELEVTGPNPDLLGVCIPKQGCASGTTACPLGETDVDDMTGCCVNEKQECKQVFDDKNKLVISYCSALENSCSNTKEFCSSSLMGMNYSICCPIGKCQTNLNQLPYCSN